MTDWPERLTFTVTFEIFFRGSGYYVRESVQGRGGATEWGPCPDVETARKLRDELAERDRRALREQALYLSENMFRSVWPRQ